MPAATSRASARGPIPGSRRIASGARNAASRPGRTIVSPPGLRRSEAIFATTFELASAERAREPRARADRGLHGLGERARVVEGRRDLAEVEIALVDPGLLDRRHDVAHERPDLLRVLAGRATCRGRTNVTVGQRRSASAHDIAEKMPKRRAA